MSAGPVTGFKRIRALAAVTASMAIMAMVFGFSFPMFSTRLAEIGVSDAMIGLNASAQAFGVFLVVWFAPRLIASQGPVRIMLAMTAIKLVAVILCMLFPSFWPWLFFRLMIGATGSILWIAGETWINEIAHEKIRGRELAIYSAALGLGTVLGNLVIEVAGFDGWLPFAALAAIVTVAAVPLLFVLRDSPRLDFARHSVGLGGFLTSFKQAPLAILLNAVFAAIFVSMHSSITIYGLDVGMSLERAVQVLIVFNIGGIVMPYAAGWLADRMDRALLSFFLVLLTTMLFVVMGWALSQPGIDLVYMFVLGGLAAAIYAIALVLLGERFRGAALASATATFTLMWNVGAALGPLITGAAMDAMGASGLPVTLAIMSAAILPLAFGAWRRRTAATVE